MNTNNPPKILIVDDDRTIAETTAKVLEKLDYNIVGIAATGEEAVRETVNKRPDVVIMDVVLQGLTNGLQASQQIQQFSSAPIIFVTGHRNVAAAMKANNHIPLLKPFTKEDLQKAITSALAANK